MSVRKWLGMVIPFGILCGLALGWMTAGAQTAWTHITMKAHWVKEFTVYPISADILAADPVYPRILPDPKGWLPVCPTGMDVVRKVPPPDCYWGSTPMNQQPTQGDFECVYTAQAKALPACPAD